MSGEKRVVRDPLPFSGTGGELMAAEWLRELQGRFADSVHMSSAYYAEQRRKEEARVAALSPMQRMRERMRVRRSMLRWKLAAKRQAFGLWIAGLDESDLGDGW